MQTTSRIKPPKVAVIVPMSTATSGPAPPSNAVRAPRTQKRAMPSASAQSRAMERRSICGAIRKVTIAAVLVTQR